jgi:methylenetetrahydrofolate dehydrogenase (NADP+) / methenyltetrahydrofolate cyclohydrolase
VRAEYLTSNVMIVKSAKHGPRADRSGELNRTGLRRILMQLGISMLLHDTLGSLTGSNALIIGRSNLVGRPVAQLLLRADCTVTVAHSRTRDIAALSRRADILVVAIGKAEFVRDDWIRPGAAVIDVGINRVPSADGKSRLVGDVAFAEALPVAGHLTPVPGGVGPMTVACPMFNTLQAARRTAGLAFASA